MNKQTKNTLKDLERRKIMKEGNKFYQYKEEIGGKEYVFQYPGRRACLKMTDEATTDNNKRLNEKFLDLMLKNIVVEPKVSLDTFDEDGYADDYERVVEIASSIFQRDFDSFKK